MKCSELPLWLDVNRDSKCFKVEIFGHLFSIFVVLDLLSAPALLGFTHIS